MQIGQELDEIGRQFDMIRRRCRFSIRPQQRFPAENIDLVVLQRLGEPRPLCADRGGTCGIDQDRAQCIGEG